MFVWGSWPVWTGVGLISDLNVPLSRQRPGVFLNVLTHETVVLNRREIGPSVNIISNIHSEIKIKGTTDHQIKYFLTTWEINC